MDIGKAKKLSSLSYKEWTKIRSNYCKTNLIKKINKTEYTKDLFDVKLILKSLDIDCWLLFGTLLGIVRDNDFLDWDDNINFGVYEEILLPKIEELKSKFISSGFIFRKIPKKNGTKINLYRYKHKVSLEALYLDRSYKGNKYRLSNRFKHPRKYFETYGTIKFKGEEFRVPTPVEEYLSILYRNWKKPINLSDLENPEKWRNKKCHKK